MAEKKLTGKQKKFVGEYLNGANFNSTLAAKKAGYQATSQHSFEAIGCELLQKPHIKDAVDSFFQAAHVSAEETLKELGRLARGNSRDKIRALALLSQHHGLLDGSWVQRNGKNQVELIVKYETQKVIDQTMSELERDVDEYNRQAEKDNKRRDEQWERLIRKYEHSQITVEALRELRDVMFGKKEVEEPQPKPVEAEIVRVPLPPTKRLPPAPIEKMMSEVAEVERVRESELCRHGYIPDDCISCREYPNDVVINPDGSKTYSFGQAARPQTK